MGGNFIDIWCGIHKMKKNKLDCFTKHVFLVLSTTMHWSTVGNTRIRHIVQHTRLLKNFTSQLEQLDVSMSTKAKSYFDLHLENIDWNKCEPNDKVLCICNFNFSNLFH